MLINYDKVDDQILPLLPGTFCFVYKSFLVINNNNLRTCDNLIKITYNY